MRDGEVIALLLFESEESDRAGAESRAECLVRRPDGRMSLEAVSSRAELDRTARNTGCFRRGQPIRDPSTHEVIGYEMEEVSLDGALNAVRAPSDRSRSRARRYP